MRIGAIIYNWEACGKCIYRDDDDGCGFDGEIETEMREDDNAVVCLTGDTCEPVIYCDDDER